MTFALCLNCGEMKFGVFGACPECNVDSNEYERINLDFSDWALSIKEMEEYGRVIKEIHAHENNDKTCFWAFILYVSKCNPEIISGSIEPDFKAELEALLAKCNFSSPAHKWGSLSQTTGNGKNISDEEKIKQLRKEYLNKGPFEIDPLCDRGLFTPEEISDLEKYGNWLEAVAYDKVPILLDSQKRFVQQLGTGVEPKGKYARLWYRYMAATEPPF